MRKVVMFGFVLLALGFFVAGVQAQRIVKGDGGGGTGTAPVSVAVANFPQVQPVQVDKTVNVTGSVAVTNFPAVQNVAGTVSISNLPTTCPTMAHFIGYTTTGISTDSTHSPDVLAIMAQCAAEVPGSRVCDLQEYLDTIPAPSSFSSAGALLWVPFNNAGDLSWPHIGCMTAIGPEIVCREPMPQPNVVACCGY